MCKMSQHDLMVLAQNPRNRISRSGESIFPPASNEHTSEHIISKENGKLILMEWNESKGWVPSNDVVNVEQWEAAE